jgi:hypothetical protein
MAQVEDPANLDRWPDPAGRLVTRLLIGCGLRIGDATRLPFDCVVRAADGASNLRYVNHKLKREALVPIDDGWNASSRSSSTGSLPAGQPVPRSCTPSPPATPTAASP